MTGPSRAGWLTAIYGHSIGRQLSYGSWSVRDIDAQFKNLLDQRRLPGLVGVEACENHFVLHRKWLPDKRVIVSEESAGRYFGAPILLRGTDHYATVKPTSGSHPVYELLLDFYQTHFAQETPQTQRDQTDKLLFVFEQKPSYPVLRFSVVNNSTRNVQIADIRAFKVASMKDNHTRSEEIMGKRVILNFNLTSATEGKGVGLLQGQVSNLAPGEAEAFELKLESENAVALVDFEAEYIAMSAKVPIKSRSQDAALVHAPTKQDNGQIMVLSRARLFESIFSEDANLSWSAPSYKSCGTHWMTLIRGAVTLTFHDSDAGWKRLKSKFENTEYFSLILASYADGLEQGFVSTFIASRLSEWISDPEKLRRLSAIDLEAPAFTISRALANRGVKFSSGAVSSQDFPCAYEISLLERLLEVSTIIDEPDDDEDNERRWGHNISKILGHASSNTMRADPAGKIAAEVQTEATEFLVATVIVQPQISHELDRVLRAVLKIKGEPKGYDDESV